jgi:hypothetical protein
VDPDSVPPPLLIVTSTPIESEELNSTVKELADRNIKVDVITFASVEVNFSEHGFPLYFFGFAYN